MMPGISWLQLIQPTYTHLQSVTRLNMLVTHLQACHLSVMFIIVCASLKIKIHKRLKTMPSLIRQQKHVQILKISPFFKATNRQKIHQQTLIIMFFGLVWFQLLLECAGELASFSLLLLKGYMIVFISCLLQTRY